MKNWITRLFGAGGDASPAPASVVPAAAPATIPTATTAGPAAATAQGSAAHQDPGLRFWHWLAAGASVDGATPDTQLVLAELARLARDPAAGAELVPRVPDIIPQLLRSLRDESVSSAELARQV